MEQQVQGLVYVDGEWVSRTTDVYQIMAQAQQRQTDTEMREPQEPPEIPVPEMGMLHKTVFASPLVKFLLPANIRHRDLNDVVMVGESAVHIKEIRDYGHLSQVACKADFNGRILAAKVFGGPRKVQVNKASSSLLPRPVIHSRTRSSTDETNELPPEVVVLTLSSRTLVFLWARNFGRSVIFRQRIVKLPAGSRLGTPGTFLAVDPKCRAIAVSAIQDQFVIYRTKSMDEWMADKGEGNPIIGERVVPIVGVVMHMEFLSPSDDDESHVILLFVVVHNRKTKITCYDWDCRYGLNTFEARTERAAIEHNDPRPQLLIPLSRRPEAILVFEDHILICKDILSGAPNIYAHPIRSDLLTQINPGASRNKAPWTQWHTAPRNPGFDKDAFYVAREDGRIMYIVVNQADSIQQSDAGVWPYPIDQAFACLSVNNSEYCQSFPDVLMAAGSASDGLLCKVGAWPTEYAYTAPFPAANKLSPLEKIPNWAPLTDISVLHLPGTDSHHDQERHRLFISNGRAPHGAITELRQGSKAIIDDSFDGMKGCMGLWVVDYQNEIVESEESHSVRHSVTFLITLPLETIAIRITHSSENDGHGDWGGWIDGSWDKVQVEGEEMDEDAIIRTTETLTACMWSEKFAIQITRNDAVILHRSDFTRADSLSFSNPVLFAVCKADCPYVVVAFREEQNNVLEIVPLFEDGNFGQNTIRHVLDCEPTCVELLVIEGVPHVFVSAFDSSVVLFKIRDTDVLAVYTDKLQTPEVQDLCESVVVLKQEDHYMLACGTRNGFLAQITLQAGEDKFQQTTLEIGRMGSTAVKVSPCSTDPSSAFLACGSDFCRISHFAIGCFRIESIWLTDHKTPSYQQSSIAAIDQLPKSDVPNVGRDLGGFIFAVSGDDMVFAQMDYDIRWSSYDVPPVVSEHSKAVPRTLEIEMTPTKLAYSHQFNKMVVAATEAKEVLGASTPYRAVYSALKVINPSGGKAEVDEVEEEMEEDQPFGHITGKLELLNYERVLSFADWSFRDERRSYRSTIVGTSQTVGQNQEKGRRLILKPSESGFRVQKEHKFDQPVRCVAMFDQTHIISVIGSTLVLEQYHDNRMVRRATQRLLSHAVHMTVCRPYIYISTAAHSFMCYELAPLAEPNTWQFTLIFGDTRSRATSYHLLVNLDPPQIPPQSSLPPITPSPPVTFSLVTDKECSLAALHHAPFRPHQKATRLMCEANLPRSIIRIHRGNIRPPWRRASTPTPGVLADDILGSCSDGTIYAIYMLSTPATRLLRLLQNLITERRNRDPAAPRVMPASSALADISSILVNGAEGVQGELVRAREVDLWAQELGHAKPRVRAVDGDLIKAGLEACGGVRALVLEGTHEDVERLFAEVVDEVFESGRWADEEERFDTVERWVGEVLGPVL